jgi:hypothetical protein
VRSPATGQLKIKAMKFLICNHQTPEQVAQMLREGRAEEAIALIRQTYFYKSPYCPKCGGKMRKDNKTGICSRCQKNKLPNSKYRRKDLPENELSN